MRHPRTSGGSLGFTLIEVLVVIVIIGIMAAVVTIAAGTLGRDTEVEDQAKRMWAVLSQVKEESELLGRNIGMIVDQTSYEFVQFDASKWVWVPVADDDLLSPRELPSGLVMTLVLEGRNVVLKPHTERKPPEEQRENADKEIDYKKTLKDADMAPQIMLLASGDVNSFDLRIAREESNYRWHIASKPDNTLDYGAVDDDAR